jgi:hypothetical protein
VNARAILGFATGGLLCLSAAAAFVLREFRPHFLLFVLTGALVLAVAGRARR